jgi:hypothetical protein
VRRLRIDRERPILVALDNAEYTFFRNHLCTTGAQYWLAFLWRHFIYTFCLTLAGAESAENVWYAPDAILISHKDVVAPQSESRFV